MNQEQTLVSKPIHKQNKKKKLSVRICLKMIKDPADWLSFNSELIIIFGILFEYLEVQDRNS